MERQYNSIIKLLNSHLLLFFCKTIYNSLEDLQIDVDHWLCFYNETRPHSSKYCYGDVDFPE
ncbi:transposase [Wolbachia endosymbiont wPip_Mol of Culex molestus]|nr:MULTISPECIES: hypothetical protein [unclassified Wolbachia]CQD06290.1 transposase [Wolbachia endosymbiont wPip_Mol of Culex molestus]